LEIVDRYDRRAKGHNLTRPSVLRLIQIGKAVALRLQNESERSPDRMKSIVAMRTDFPLLYSILPDEWTERLNIMQAIRLGENSPFQAGDGRGPGRKPKANIIRKLIRQNLRDIEVIKTRNQLSEYLPKEEADLFPAISFGCPSELIDRVLKLPPLTSKSREAYASVITDMIIAKGENAAAWDEITRVRRNAKKQNAWHARKRLLDPNKKVVPPKPSRAKVRTILCAKILKLLEIDLKQNDTC